jgi:hypothetical protein
MGGVMNPARRARLAPRFQVRTTPIRWWVPKAKRRASKPVLAEAAVIEVSVVGAAIVCPNDWAPVVGTRVEASWGDVRGTVIIRRAVPYPGSAALTLYGVEYGEQRSALGMALYERLVVDAGALQVPADAPVATPPASSLPPLVFSADPSSR